MDVHAWQMLTVFFLTLGASTFSGMAGGGGGFIILPVLIALGLSPQQAVATGKLSAFGLSVGSLAAFKRRALSNPKLLVPLVVLAAVISFFVPHVLREINGHTFQRLLGAIIIALIPVVLAEKSGLKNRRTSLAKNAIGYVLVGAVLFLQGIFSGGIGSLNNVMLIYFFGLSALQANATRRVVTLVLNVFIVVALAVTTHFIIYKLALPGMAGSLLGGYFGSKIALKEGERFAKYALVAFMLVSGAWLLIAA